MHLKRNVQTYSRLNQPIITQFSMIGSGLFMYFRCEYYKIFTSKSIFKKFVFSEKFFTSTTLKLRPRLPMFHRTFEKRSTERSDPLQALKTCLERIQAPGAQYILVPKIENTIQINFIDTKHTRFQSPEFLSEMT